MMNKVKNVKRSSLSRKGGIATIAAIVVVAGLIISFKSEEKKYSVTLTLNQWQGVVNTLNNCDNCPHGDVKITTGWITNQIQEQLKDTTTK